MSGLAGLTATFASQGGGFSVSALVKVSTEDPIRWFAQQHDPGFTLVSPIEHYDGVYYYTMAVDPLATGQAHTLIDQAAYRYGHPLHGWLAGLISLGQPQLVPAALFILGLLGMCLTGWLASRLAYQLGASPWLGLAAAASPGLLFATTVDTTETIGAALVLGALLAWHRRRWGWATVLIVLCCLDKEQYIAVPAGLAVYEAVWAWRQHEKRASLIRRIVALCMGPLLLGCWYLYVHGRFHRWPFIYETGNLGAPVVGWLQTFGYAHRLSTSGDSLASQIGSIVAPVLICYVVLLAAAAVVAVRMDTVLAAPTLLLTLITASQGWRTLLYPHEIFRTPAVVTLLAVLVLLTAATRNVDYTHRGGSGLQDLNPTG